MQTATISIHRATSLIDSVRTYGIKLDGKKVGHLSNKQILMLPIEPGRHTLAVTIDWCGSPPVEFAINPGDKLHFQCGNRLKIWNPFRVMYRILFRPREYLFLEC